MGAKPALVSWTRAETWGVSLHWWGKVGLVPELSSPQSPFNAAPREFLTGPQVSMFPQAPPISLRHDRSSL